MADIATAGQTLTVIESVPLLQDEALPAVDDELQVQPSVPSLNEVCTNSNFANILCIL